MNRFKIFGWGLLSALVLVWLIAIDQLFLFSLGESQNHFLYCRIWESSGICSRSAFRAHPRHLFLLDPSRSNFLARLARTPEIPKHNDYNLNENGFRLAVPRAAEGRKIKVNIFGDSFAFGLFLKEGEHIGSLLNAMPSECVFRNYSVPAFDFRQMIGLSQDAELVNESDLDLFLFISDDIFERITRPFEVHRFGRGFNSYDLSRMLRLEPVFPFSIPPFWVNNSFLFQTLESIVERRFWDSLNRDIFLDRMLPLHQPGAKRKMYFHIPIPGDYVRGPDGALKLNQSERIAEVSIGERVLKDEKSFEALFFQGDGHPNPEGAKWIAAKVMERVSDTCRPR